MRMYSAFNKNSNFNPTNGARNYILQDIYFGLFIIRNKISEYEKGCKEKLNINILVCA